MPTPKSSTRAPAPSPATTAPEAEQAPADEKLPIAEAAEAPDPNELVGIFNKNPQGGDYVEHQYEDKYTIGTDGKKRFVSRKRVAEHRAVAGAFSHVPRWVADKWKKMAPEAIIDAASMGRPAAEPAATAKLAALSGENAAMRARLESLEQLIAELRKPEGPAK